VSRQSYLINEIFLSPQGEGIRAGTLNVFIRFTACNLQCRIEPGPLSPGGFDCDTEFASGVRYTLAELLERVAAIGNGCKAVILTGGEPTLQMDMALLGGLRGAGYFIAVETNGTAEIDRNAVDWIACSPKVAEHAVRLTFANELRYVRSAGQGIPKPSCKADHYLLSPAWDGTGLPADNMKAVLQLQRENPTWRISVQQHKLWAVR
jgi:7-carboxy-7-deazaguanine synthase